MTTVLNFETGTPIIHFWLQHIAHCIKKIVSMGSLSAERVGQKEVGGPQGDMHMVAARLGFEKAMVVTVWVISHPDCMDRLRNCYSHILEAGKEGCLGSE